MNDDLGFLDAIQANPHDETARLVYADWLDERGDNRAEYLRLEHQLLVHIPHRLAQLRETIDPSWLDAMSRRRKVVLTWSRPDRKIQTIKIVREITNLGLKEAKDLVENVPATIADGLTLEE